MKIRLFRCSFHFYCFFMINKHVIIIVYIISVICGFSLYNIFLYTYSFAYDCLMLRLIHIHSQIHLYTPTCFYDFSEFIIYIFWSSHIITTLYLSIWYEKNYKTFNKISYNSHICEQIYIIYISEQCFLFLCVDMESRTFNKVSWIGE